MKKKLIILGIIFGVLLITVAVLYSMCIGNCKVTGGENFGDFPGENPALTSVGTVVLNPQKYLDKEVTVKGTIESECPGGGWIRVKDDSNATIYVEMHHEPWVPIPQRVGSKAFVTGTVYQTQSTPKETGILVKGLRIPAFSCTKAHAHETHDCTMSKLFSACCCK